jgi:hypothetical protein
MVPSANGKAFAASTAEPVGERQTTGLFKPSLTVGLVSAVNFAPDSDFEWLLVLPPVAGAAVCCSCREHCTERQTEGGACLTDH